MSAMDDYHDTFPVQDVFASAKQFGLTDREVLRTVGECLSGVDADESVGELRDQLSAALARSILCKEQRRLSEVAPQQL
jgi:hypothetical protein